jgi:hypothetical protein
VEGRCGYIRGGQAYILKDYGFNSVVLNLEGKNSQMVDMDYYTASISTVEDSMTPVFMQSQSYFGLNPYIQTFTSLIPRSFKEAYFYYLRRAGV